MFLPGVQPYSLSPDEKRAFLSGQLRELLEHHKARCPEYARLVDDALRHRMTPALSVEDYPFVPVTVFKEYDLTSTSEAVISVRSSATTSDTASRIFVDRATRSRQTLSATKILADFVGQERRPYLVFDSESTVRSVGFLNARGAAILSLAPLASEFHFVMAEQDGELCLDEEALQRAVAKMGDQPFIAYGLTHILYQTHRHLEARGLMPGPAHPASVLLHSGGWKRLTTIAVDKPTFNQAVAGVWGLRPERVLDFYGAVEQVGMPYPDCPEGFKHVPYWADVIVRRSDTLDPANLNETGLIQLISCLPLSAPNHSVLTEDLGELLQADRCRCGRRGKAFVFRGRAPRSEGRGCSDVARH